jgi:hypothetical protein
VDGTPEESDAMLAAIKATLQNLPQPATATLSIAVTKPKITAAELLEDFLREGLGSGRWKNPEKTSSHEYGPIWAKFSPHADKHGLTLDAAIAYRAEVIDSAPAPT